VPPDAPKFEFSKFEPIDFGMPNLSNLLLPNPDIDALKKTIKESLEKALCVNEADISDQVQKVIDEHLSDVKVSFDEPTEEDISNNIIRAKLTVPLQYTTFGLDDEVSCEPAEKPTVRVDSTDVDRVVSFLERYDFSDKFIYTLVESVRANHDFGILEHDRQLISLEFKDNTIEMEHDRRKISVEYKPGNPNHSGENWVVKVWEK